MLATLGILWFFASILVLLWAHWVERDAALRQLAWNPETESISDGVERYTTYLERNEQ
jgi:hypothetical protein